MRLILDHASQVRRETRMRAAAVATVIAATTLVGCAATVDPGLHKDSAANDAVTVYVGKETAGDNGKPLLYPHTIPVQGNATVEAAVDALKGYEPEKPFYTLWDGFCSLGEDLDEVTVTEDLITIHFNENAGATCDLSPQGWQLRRQQIAWTVRTATGSRAPVRVTTGEDRYRAEEAVVAQRRYLAPTQAQSSQ